MKRFARESAYAVLAWLVPFAVSVCIFPLKQVHRPLFESVMALTLVANTTLLGLSDLRRAGTFSAMRAARVGVTWTIANWALDLVMFSDGPMKMPFQQYVMEIAAAYLVIPVIMIGLAAAARLGHSQGPPPRERS